MICPYCGAKECEHRQGANVSEQGRHAIYGQNEQQVLSQQMQGYTSSTVSLAALTIKVDAILKILEVLDKKVTGFRPVEKKD